MKKKMDDSDFQKFRDIIYNESGINFTTTNRPILESRLKERLRKIKMESYKEYFQFISNNNKEMKNLLDLVTTNLTKFFRNTTHFEALENFVIKDIKEKKSTKSIKVWSAGCSTGEEPYSIAMVISEILDPSWKINIIASDISFNVLMKAKEGFYEKPKVIGIPEKYMKKYMIEIGDGYYVKDEIKNLVQFDYHNLQYESGFQDFDIVFCRNVIIYFDNKAQKNVINRMYQKMNNYAYLFIGHSESLFGMETKFIFTKIDNACLYMKKEGKYGEQK